MLDRLTIERMTTKAGEGPILIALSGGGDSVALLHLMVRQFGAPRLRGVVVDHALREGSDADAEAAAGFARAVGVAVEVVRLAWEDGANRAHQAAREARYAALCAAARRHGAQIIATGHTRDDQAETVLLRGARGSGQFGLAGMRALSPAPLWPDGRSLWLARPLLKARRHDLRTFLRDSGGEWIEDPSNAKARFARVRARRVLAELEQDGLDPMRFARLAERLASEADALDDAAYRLIDTAVAFDAGSIVIRPAFWAGERAVRHRALAALLTAAGGQQRPPGAEQIAAFDAAAGTETFQGATLGGALARRNRGEVTLTRDRGAMAGRADGTSGVAPLALEPGREVIWDNRLALTAAEPGWFVVFENGRAQLARGEQRAPLDHVAPRWLLNTRVQHVLGRG